MARAHWKKDGIENVLHINWNIFWKWLYSINATEQTDIIAWFICVDFHEWLHLWMRRNVPGTYHVSGGDEKFVTTAEYALAEIVCPRIYAEEYSIPGFPFETVSG